MARRMTQMADEAKVAWGVQNPSEAPDAPWIDDDTGPFGHMHYTQLDPDDVAEQMSQIFKEAMVSDFDEVERPAHYNQGKHEVIDIIQDKLTDEQYRGYLEGNILKYVLRHQYKGHPKQDLEKAYWYLNRLIGTFND